ncbi:MAG: GNAT family N-acetyltransferase [Acidobacteriia bacterium]|nr:GNAT family N-acetyltransferase [Terriglobia bacterium]
MEIELREPASPPEWDLYYDLRWRVLRERWTQVRETGRDEHESNAFHLTAWIEGKLAGTGRLHFNSRDEAQVRFMAVEEIYARQGIGSRILDALEAHAREHHARRIVLNARESAVDFYRAHGYRLVDQSATLFDSIVHWRMQKDLQR